MNLFLLLSGCVMEAAYGRRLASGMGLATLLRIRVVRLWPLYVLGLAPGIAYNAALWAEGRGFLGGGTIVAAALLGLLLVPAPPTGRRVSPLNLPVWSLTFELGVNIVFGLVRRRLGTAALIAIVAGAGLWLAPLTLAHDGLSFGDVWSNVVPGSLRVTFSFFLGVPLLRLPRPAARETAWALVLPVAAAALLARRQTSGALDLLAAFAVFPPLVWAGLWVQPPRRLVPLFRAGGAVS